MVSCSRSPTLSTYGVMLVTSMAYSSSHSCVGAPGEGLVVYPWSPGPVTSGRSCSRDAWYSAGPCWLRGWGGCAAGRWTGVSRAPARGAEAAGGHFAQSRRGRGLRGRLLGALALPGLGPYAARCPPCVGAPALAGCQCRGPWDNRGCPRVGVQLCGAVGVLCWCSGQVPRPVRGCAPLPGKAPGLTWLWCVAACWWLSRPVVF